MARLDVTYLRTTTLKPDPRNPRVHTDKQVRQIAQSIASAQRMYFAVCREAFEEVARLEGQQSSDVGKYKTAKELTEEQLMWLAAQGLQKPEEEK